MAEGLTAKQQAFVEAYLANGFNATAAALGLTQDAGDTTEATDAGRRLLAALERGDVRGALAAIQDGKAAGDE